MTRRNLEVRLATSEDLDGILPWLEADYVNRGEGFWPNCGTICGGIAKGDLYVATSGDAVVGLQLGATKIELIQVKSRQRKRGVGTRLIADVCRRAGEVDENYVLVGALDEDFWFRRGFAKHSGHPMGGKTLMALHIPTWRRQQLELRT
jgi:GNAT superfamily N-acetyltransferase